MRRYRPSCRIAMETEDEQTETDMLLKNQIIETEIEDLTNEGLGVGKWDGQAVFIKDTVPGDRVRALVIKVKKTYAYARLQEIIRPGADRVEPVCPAARACGGCQLQMLSYSAQLVWKEKKVRDTLTRIGGFAGDSFPVFPVLPAESTLHYRNKAQYPVGRGQNGEPQIGFYAGRTHSIIETEDCSIGHPGDREIIECVRTWMKEHHVNGYDEAEGSGLVRHIMVRSAYETGERMTVLVVNGRRLPAEESLCRSLMALPGMCGVVLDRNETRGNVILGRDGRVLAGRDYFVDYIDGIRYKISYRSFFQVNPRQTRRLYETAVSFAGLTGKETVWDLYCGTGTISLFLARQAARVYGVEIIPEAIEDARKNAAENGMNNARFFVGKAEEVLPRMYEQEGISADVMVIDPPRKGCDEAVLRTMAAMAPQRIVYVSCDPATLARDLKYLAGAGYRVEKVQPVDMFPQTCHIETIVLLQKLNS